MPIKIKASVATSDAAGDAALITYLPPRAQLQALLGQDPGPWLGGAAAAFGHR